MNKVQKSALVTKLKDKLTNSDFISIIHYSGMNAQELYNLRVSLKSENCNMVIAKNTLIRNAIKGTNLEELTPHLLGPTAVLYSKDPVTLARIVSNTGKKVEALKIKVGFFKDKIIDESSIKSMAKLGSLNDVRASFIGLLKGAQSNFVRVISSPAKGLASLKN